ncbi:hypothetical protein FO519_009252, partial [Halicephalobus sp. NKZ332]
MKNILFLLFFFIFEAQAQGSCPQGSIPSFNKDVCWFLVGSPLDFIDSEQYCRGLGGHLASIHNAFDNVYLAVQAKQVFLKSDRFTVGGNNLESRLNWTWVNGDPFDFTDWDTYEPQNINQKNCLHVDMDKGLWYSADCFIPVPFVCQVYLGSLPPTTKPPIVTTTTRGLPDTTTTRPPTTTTTTTTPPPTTTTTTTTPPPMTTTTTTTVTTPPPKTVTTTKNPSPSHATTILQSTVKATALGPDSTATESATTPWWQ